MSGSWPTLTMETPMSAALPGESDPRSQWAPLIDVSDVPLRDMLADGRGNPALARSTQRLVRSLDDPNGVISAFSSFVE
jgi:FXSXX-COOH protein